MLLQMAVDKDRDGPIVGDEALSGDNAQECGSHSGPRWYIAQTHVGRHYEARDRLIAQHFEAILPLGARPTLGGGFRIEPLFGPYLLVRFDVTQPGWRKVPHTRGIRRVFGTSAEHPTPIRDVDAMAIRELTISTDHHDGPAERGHAVRVVDGPWRGKAGLCIDVVAGVVRALLFLEHGPRDCEVLARWCRRA